MRKTLVVTIIAVMPCLGTAWAQEEEKDPIQNAIEACQPEIETYCSQVTLGDGRLLACFYAHEDKLSGRCSWALYEGAAALQDFANAVSHVATQCWDDLVEHCGDVEMGEGRVGTCLLDHKDQVSEACRQAIDDIGMERVED